MIHSFPDLSRDSVLILGAILAALTGGAAPASTSAPILASMPISTALPSIQIPGYTAYVEPDPEALSVSPEKGVDGWSDAREKIVWYGGLVTPGRLSLSILLQLPEGASSRLRLSAARLLGPVDRRARTARAGSLTAAARGAGAEPVRVDFGVVEIRSPGTYRFELAGLSRSGREFGVPTSLILTGSAAAGAHFSMAETRGAPSVHLWYQPPPNTPVTAFYNEVTVKTDPLWSYYMACGFNRGYFGIQVNSPTERRIIFSVWDSGKEPVDRSKVASEDRVQLVAKGPGVLASGFGNEGTGGHSHLVYPWKTGHTYRFVVTARPEGEATVYSGYFYFPEKRQWGLIASFRAPKDGGYLRGLYSFNEDFNGANGQQRRLAEFGPQWIRATDGNETQLLTASFTHTADGVRERLDRGAGVDHDRFYLTNGGFIPLGSRYGDKLVRLSTGAPAPDLP